MVKTVKWNTKIFLVCHRLTDFITVNHIKCNNRKDEEKKIESCYFFLLLFSNRKQETIFIEMDIRAPSIQWHVCQHSVLAFVHKRRNCFIHIYTLCSAHTQTEMVSMVCRVFRWNVRSSDYAMLSMDKPKECCRMHMYACICCHFYTK